MDAAIAGLRGLTLRRHEATAQLRLLIDLRLVFEKTVPPAAISVGDLFALAPISGARLCPNGHSAQTAGHVEQGRGELRLVRIVGAAPAKGEPRGAVFVYLRSPYLICKRKLLKANTAVARFAAHSTTSVSVCPLRKNRF